MADVVLEVYQHYSAELKFSLSQTVDIELYRCYNIPQPHFR